MLDLIERIKAKRAAKKDEKSLMKNQRAGILKKITRSVGIGLDYDLVLARNARDQEIDVLMKKQNLAKNIHKMSMEFLKKAQKRKKELDNADPEQESVISDELASLEHIELYAKKMEETLAMERDHDLKPLIAKASMISKMINAEERMGAVNPSILKQFEVYEASLLARLEKHGLDSVKQDEFSAIEHFIIDLKKERTLLEKLFEKNRSKKARKRIQETIAEELMLDNILRMTAIEKVRDSRLRNNSLKIYKALERIDSMEKKEKQILK